MHVYDHQGLRVEREGEYCGGVFIAGSGSFLRSPHPGHLRPPPTPPFAFPFLHIDHSQVRFVNYTTTPFPPASVFSGVQYLIFPRIEFEMILLSVKIQSHFISINSYSKQNTLGFLQVFQHQVYSFICHFSHLCYFEHSTLITDVKLLIVNSNTASH